MKEDTACGTAAVLVIFAGKHSVNERCPAATSVVGPIQPSVSVASSKSYSSVGDESLTVAIVVVIVFPVFDYYGP